LGIDNIQIEQESDLSTLIGKKSDEMNIIIDQDSKKIQIYLEDITLLSEISTNIDSIEAKLINEDAFNETTKSKKFNETFKCKLFLIMQFIVLESEEFIEKFDKTLHLNRKFLFLELWKSHVILGNKITLKGEVVHGFKRGSDLLGIKTGIMYNKIYKNK